MLTRDDVRRLCIHFKYSYEEFYEKYLDKSMKIPYLKYPCPFLNEENRCTIYHIRPKVCKTYPFVDFLMVVKPCLLGEEILNIMMRNGDLFKENKNDVQHLQKLYDDRVDMLDTIAGTEKSRGVEYHSIFIDRNILGKIIKILKKNNGN
jgi:Fe-S-cluster containining protein